MKRSKQIAFSEEMRKMLMLQRNGNIEDAAESILMKKYEDDIKEEYPDATLSKIKSIVKERHQKEFNDIKNQVVAPLYHEQATDIIRLTKESTIISNKKQYNHADRYLEKTDLPDIYSKMNLKTALFDTFEKYGTSFNNTDKKQTGSTLIKNVIKFDKLNYSHTKVKAAQTLDHAVKAYDFFKKADKFMSYDYETLGGTDEFGYKRTDALVEFAYGIYDKELGVHKKSQTIVGLTTEQEKNYRALIKDVDKNGFLSGQQEVINHRIGLYGHKDTVITKGKNGMYAVEKMADLEGGYKFSQAEIDQGFKRLTSIYSEQAQIKTKSGLLSWQEKYAEMLRHKNDKSLAVLDYNGIVADRPWENKFLATMGLNKEQEKTFLDIAGMESMFMDTTSERFLDVRIPTRFASETVGPDAYYKTKEAREVLKNQTPFSQEGLTRMLFGDLYKGGAHTAGFDAELLANLAVSTKGQGMDGKVFLDQLFEDAQKNRSSNNGSIRTGNLDLLMAGESTQFFKGGSGPLSYVYDPVNKTYRTANQYSVGSDINKEITRESPIKRGRLYTVDFAGEVDMTADWVKNMDGLHDEYAQNKLYAIKLNPFFDEKIAGSHQGLRGHSALFFNSKEQMEATLSNMHKVGERDDVKQGFRLVGGKAGEEVKKNFATFNIKDKQLIPKSNEVTIDGIISQATKGDINDTAARMIREGNWKKANNFSQLYHKLEAYNEGAVTGKQANKIMLDLMQANDRKLSKTVSNGQTISLSFDDVQQALGYTLDGGESHNLIANTFNNQMTAFNYMSSQMPIADTILNHLTEQGEEPFKNAAVTQFKFQSILDALTEKGIAEITSDPEKARKLLNNTDNLNIFGKDLNFFNFDTREFFTDRSEQKYHTYLKPTLDEDILRIDLGPGKEFKFVDNLIKRNIHGSKDLSSFQKNQEGLIQLRSFVGKVRDSNQYRGLFDKFSDEEMQGYTRSDVLGNALIQNMKTYRTANPAAGYLADAYSQDATIRNEALDHISKDPVKLKQMITSIHRDIPNYVQVSGDEGLKSHVQNMLDNILVDKIDPLAYSKEYGFTDIQAKHFGRLYDQSKKEYAGFLEEFIGAFTQGKDTEFMYDTKSKSFALMHNNQKVDINLPKLKAQDGNFFIDLDSTKVALHSKLDASRAIAQEKYGGPGSVEVITNFGAAIKKTKGMVNFHKVAKKGDGMNEILHRSTSVMQNLSQHLRKGSSVDYNDILDIQTPYRIDYQDLMELTPLMKEAGILTGREWRDKDFLNRMTKGLSYDKSNTAQREILQKNIPELFRILAEENGGFNEDTWIGLISKNLSFSLKESQVAELTGLVGGIAHRAGWQFNNNSRPVINQTRSVLYRTSEWEKALESKDFKGRNISLNPVTSTDSTKALYNRRINGLGKDNRTSLELYTGKANMSEVHYRSAVSEHFLKKKNLSAREEKVFNKLKSINLTEQEQVMDTRLADNFFNRMQEQKINSRKQLSFYMDINESTIKEVDDLRSMVPKFELNKATGKIEFKYGKGVYKNRHDKLLSLAGYSSDYVQASKITGKFNQGFFTKTDGMLVNETEINELIKGAKTANEARRIVSEILDEAFYVKPTDQLGYKKVLQGFVEKGMAYSPYSGLGELDEQVDSYMKLFNKDLRGKVATNEFIQDEILSKFDNSIGAQAGIGSRKELEDLIYKERHEAFDTIRSIIGGKGQDYSIISNHGQGKHQNRQLAFEELLGSMRKSLTDSGMKEADAMEKIYNELKSSGALPSGITFKDGALHYPNQLKGGEDGYDLSKIRQVLRSDERYKGIEGGIALTANGKTVGSYTTTSISESRDYQWLSGRTDEKLVDSIMSIDEKIAKATGFEKERLQVQRKNMSMAYDWNTKGQKITDREMQNLNLQRYDDNVVQTMQEKLITNGDASMFEEVMGHVLQKDANGNFIKRDGNYQLNEKDKGRSMLSGYTNSLKQAYLTGGKDVLDMSKDGFEKTLERNYISDSVREGIRSLVDANDGKLSKDTAEQLYSMSRGIKALEFNSGKLDIEAMQKEGFEIKRANEIYKTFNQGKMSLEHPDSIFNKNLIIDFGPEHTLAKDRYVAMPFAPASMTGDTVIRENFQKKLYATLGANQRVEEFGIDDVRTGTTKDALINRFVSHKEELLDEIDLYSISGKKGVAGQFNVRLEKSVVGKASSLVILDPDKLDNEAAAISRDAWSRALVNAGGDKLAAMSSLNDPSVSKALFMNKSIMEHYSEGRYVNSSFAGMDIFNELGVFKESYMKERGFTSKDALIQHLQTEGIMVNATRTPVIKFDSSAPSMLYLDGTLQGKQIKTLLEQQLARTEDNDGDQPSFSILEIDGKDSLLAKKTGAIQNEDWRDARANIVDRAIGSNQYWHDKAYTTLSNDTKNAITNGNFFSLSGDIAIDNKIYAEYAVNPTSESIKAQHEVLGQFKKEFADANKARYNIDKVDDFKLDLGNTDMLSDIDSYISNMADKDLAQTYKNAVIFDNAFMRTEIGAEAKVRKNAIGEANLSLFKLRKTADLALPKYGENADLRYMLQSSFESIEQEVISSKKGSVREYVTKVEDFRKALNKVTTGSADGKREMYSWFETNLKSAFIEENVEHLKAINGYMPKEMTGEKAFNYMAENVINALSSLDTHEQNVLRGQNSLGTSLRVMSRINTGAFGYITDDESTFTNSGLALMKKAELINANVISTDTIEEMSQKRLKRASSEILDDGLQIARESTKSTVKQATSEIGEALTRGITDMTSNKMGIGALGLAAAYMITGFVGSNASAPNDAAPQMAQEEQAPMLSDNAGMYSSGQQSPSGYVINVRGSGSPAAMTQAQRSINQSMSNMVGSNMNIRMNIVESNGNINDRYLDELLINAIGR